MKAPDKIYLTTSAENEKYGNNWGCWTDKECPGETYIRKEALLEWLKKEIAFYPDEIYSNDHYEDGAKEALQGVINKLNAM